MILEQGRLPQNWINGASATTIRALTEDLRRRLPESRYVTEVSLGRVVKRIFKGIRSDVNGHFFIKLVSGGRSITERSTRHHFPPLDRARRMFADHLGATVPWNLEITDWQTDTDPESPPIQDAVHRLL